MSHLDDISRRHRRDLWTDFGFLATALLLLALAFAATTSKVAGDPSRHTWSVTVIDPSTQHSL